MSALSPLSDSADEDPLPSSGKTIKGSSTPGVTSATVPHLRIDESPLVLRPNSSSSRSSPSTSPSPPSSPNSRTAPAPTAPPLYRLTLTSRVVSLLSILLSCIALLVILDSFTHHQRDANGCQPTHARPVYIRQEGFDSEMTRFASKYALYLYREQDIDVSDQPTGVPVLFIPGHAGSYKQIRAIAAETASYYYHHYASALDLQDRGMRTLDFFTIDSHEEFSALHGQSLLEQAEYLNDAIDYILKLYPNSRKTGLRMSEKFPDPSSVIIIGHSMGGVVARTMFTLHNYQPGSINTIITLSTPHLLPPAPFDWKISKIYDDIHQFWIDGYTSDNPRTSLKDVTLFSITGGTLDNIVCSDSANVGTFLPSSNGFTVFTTAIPHVWTGTDHLSVLSCNQLVRVLAKSMLDLVDATRVSQTKPVHERMHVMQKAFLSGLEDRAGDGSDLSLGPGRHLDILHLEDRLLPAGMRLIVSSDIDAGITFLPTYEGADAFSILTDYDPDQFELLGCTREGRVRADTERIACRSIAGVAVDVPSSTPYDEQPFSGRTFTFASILFEELRGHEWLAVMDHGKGSGFLVVEPYSTMDHTHRIDKSMLGIALKGVHLSLEPSLFSTVVIPAIENPMLAYHLKVSRPSCQAQDNLFAPFLRQSISSMHESKFYVNLAGDEDETDVSLHGRTAFSSNAISPRDHDHQGLSMQIWMDPTCPQPLEIDLAIDWYGSAGRLGFRNGMMLAAFAIVLVVSIFAAQVQCYNKTGVFPHFGQGLAFCIRRTLPVMIPIVALCSIYQCVSMETLPLDPLDVDLVIPWHDILAGNTDPFFWWLPVAGLAVITGIMSLIWIMVDSALQGCAIITKQAQLMWPSHWWSRKNEKPDQRFQRRAATTLVLFVLVATCIPYQFVFVVAFLVHIITCVHAKVRLGKSENQSAINRYHYLQSILLLLITLLPFNLPILVVWIRNLSVYWFVPFSSDHSVFAIAPYMLYVELLTGRKMLPRTSGISSLVTYLVLYGMVVYAFLYGIKYTHSLYFSSNVLIIWLLFLHGRQSHHGRKATRYLLDHLHPFKSKKHS